MIHNYTPERDGAITAVHIHLKDGYKPMATLLPAFGGRYLIHWDSVIEREPFLKGINAYTIFFDERAKRADFESYWRVRR